MTLHQLLVLTVRAVSDTYSLFEKGSAAKLNRSKSKVLNDVSRCRQSKHDFYWSGEEIQRPHCFALTITSFKDLPFLYEIRGGLLNIFLSKGWLCIRFHLFIRIRLSSGIDGRYSVTNGKICKSFIWKVRNYFRFRDVSPGAIEVTEMVKSRVRFCLPLLFKRFRFARRRCLFHSHQGASRV